MSPLPPGVRRAFRLALRRPRIEVEVDEEVAFHLAMRTEELMARGLSSDEARAEAQRRFGNTRYWSRAMRDTDLERVRAHRRMEWLDSVRQDARYALRTFARAPLFAALAIVTLALGIGANAAVFGVVKSAMLDALPYHDVDRLVRVYGTLRDGSLRRAPTSAGMLQDVREQNRSFTSLAAFRSWVEDGVYTTEADALLVKILRVEP